MKSYIPLLALAASVEATFNKKAPAFSCPENTNNKCTPKQNSGFDWSDLNLGDFSNYNDFNFKGFSCGGGGGGTGRSGAGAGKFIGGTCHSDKGKSPSFGSKDGFSLGSIRVEPEFDCDLEFHYEMPNGSTCKHRNACKKSGTTVVNKQCGGAKGVTIIYPPQAGKPKPSCSIKVPTVSFDCSTAVSTKTPSSTKATSTKVTSTKATSKAVSTTSEVKATSTSVSKPQSTSTSTAPAKTSTAPGKTSTTVVPESSSKPAESSSKPVESSSKPVESSSKPAESSSKPAESSSKPAESSTAPGETSTAPAASSTAPAGSSTSAAGSSTAPGETSTAVVPGSSTAPGETSTAPGETSTAPAESSTAPGQTSTAVLPESSTAPAASSTPITTVITTEFESTSTIFTTSVQTITSCAPTVPNCPGNGVVTTIVTIAVSTTICPVTETRTTVISAPTAPVGGASSVPAGGASSVPAGGASSVPAGGDSSVPAGVETTSAPIGGGASTTVAAGTTLTAVKPIETLPCPEVVPSCLNTFMFSVGCADNTDSACYCPDALFVKNVYDCLYAHGESDQVISEAVIFFQGICAPWVGGNPAVVTAPTITSYLTITATPTVGPVYATITVDQTTVVPCTDEAGQEIPSSSTTIIISTTMQVPQVGFTTGVQGGVDIVPITAAPIVDGGNNGGNNGGGAVITTNGTTIQVPTGTGSIRPTSSVVLAGSGRVGTSFGLAAAVAALAAFAL